MAPKAKASSDSMKQKSLMSFFGKGGPKDSKPPLPEATKNSQKSARPPRTPDAKIQSSPVSLSSPSSSHMGSTKESPPTSDPPKDIDMMSDTEAPPKPNTLARTKRKIVVEDSDSDVPRTDPPASSSPGEPLGGRIQRKKQRISEPPSDDEDEIVAVKSLDPSRFTSTKKRIVRKSSAASDDDDFIVPSDSESDGQSVRSSSSRLSRRSGISSEDNFDDDDGDDDDDSAPKKKSKPPKKGASTKGASKDASSSMPNMTSGASFLTAAEQRERGKKDEKKAAEEPYAFLQTVMDKDKNKPGDPGYDPRTLYVPPSAWKEFTPFEKQFWEIKQNHYDTVLFFQKGKFFELYEDDARIGHQEFDLKLTQRVKMCMVGVPEMSFNFWAAKFLGKGYKVGRVDQAETALGAEMRLTAEKKSSSKAKAKSTEEKAKDKIVRRELNKVYTNGTLVDPGLLHDDLAGHCVSIKEDVNSEGTEERPRFGVCVLDCATSEFNMSAFEDDVCRTKLETLLRQLRPKEMIFTKGTLSVTTTRLLKSILPVACLWTSLRQVEGFSYEETIEQLKKIYQSDGEDDTMEEDDSHGLPSSVPPSIREMVDFKTAIEALGSMIWYLRTLNIDKEILTMKNFNVYDPMTRGQGLVLDGQTLAHLEILLNNEGTDEGSLLKLLNRCTTPFGKRLFRIWLCMPLREISDINARLDAVQDLMENPAFEEDFLKIAKGLPDLERAVSRIHAGSCKVKDFLKVLTSFQRLSNGFSSLTESTASFQSKTIMGLLRGAPDLTVNIKNVESMYMPTDKDADELTPRSGKDVDYDAIVAEIEDLERGLDDELKKFEKKLGCTLTYWHSAQGNKEIYLVQTKPTQKNIPKDWTKSGSTKAAVRWVVPSLQGTVRALKEARETRNTTIKSFRSRVYAEFDTDRSLWLRAIRVFAELDCLISLAKSSLAIDEPSCRPEFVAGDMAFVDFEELRHPTLSMSANVRDFIPNDVKLGGDYGRIALLTGPNMAGKSTAMRMTATGVIMAQLGMMVPASKARLCPVDSILTRMGAYDNMFSNASTFKVELDECCKILRDATPKSLVILDELGRGTSTYDGMAIAGAVLHQLATHTLPLSFFATHYGSLTDDYAWHPNIRQMHMSTIVDNDKRDIVFLYKLVEGAATSSFGTHVANLAGVPLPVVERADVVSKQFAQQFKERLEDKRTRSAASRLPLPLQADFAYLVGLATGKIELPPDSVRRHEVLAGIKATMKNFFK
ncbi:DNA mismatch repair protein [Pleurotus pulmonarius]